MRKLKITVAVLLTLVVLAVAVAYLLPAKWSVERSVTINAAPETVYPHVANLRKWQAWQPWNVERDPTLKITYSGPESGVGAKYDWTSENLDTGSLTIAKADPNKHVTYDIFFKDHNSKATGHMILEKTDAATKLTWRVEGDAGMNPIGRYFTLLFESLMGPDLEKGLASLKKVAETPVDPSAK